MRFKLPLTVTDINRWSIEIEAETREEAQKILRSVNLRYTPEDMSAFIEGHQPDELPEAMINLERVSTFHGASTGLDIPDIAGLLNQDESKMSVVELEDYASALKKALHYKLEE